MLAPKPIVDPPFNIVRASHVTLGVADLARSRAFYEQTLGLHVEDASSDAIHLRGVEERQHHSLVLSKSRTPRAHHLGFKVASEEDLDKAAYFFKAQGLTHAFSDVDYQGRTLRALDPLGTPIELYFKMERREILLQKYQYHTGAQPQRLDHFNVFAPDVQIAIDFYAALGFRLTEYAQEDGPLGRIAAAWMHRKGNVHDLALTNGSGPRLHHLAYWVPTALNIIHLCDVMATTGYLANLERGPGRHGISMLSFCMCGVRMATAWNYIPATIRRWIPTTSRSVGRCAIHAARPCGASPPREAGSSKVPCSRRRRRGRRYSRPT
jgi:catechol 2,3-dioxygenase